ncbi:MAG: Flp pilus assembly protein CpaB [Myxococcales bacterium]
MSRQAMAATALIATAGALAFHFYLRRFELEMAGGEPRPVLITTSDLTLGQVITRSTLDAKDVPESYVEERHILANDLERVLGARVTSAIPGGGALLWTDLDTMQDGRTLSGLVRVGMRGYALSERDASFDGLLRPGDRVDVVFIEAETREEATTLLTNVLVLTVGADLGDEGHGAAREAGRVTLSVTPEQAALLALREGVGRIRLTLRNPQDAVVHKPSANVSAALTPPGGDHGGN